MNKDLEIGQRVMLSINTRWNTDSYNNPLGVPGTVDHYRQGWVLVRWDNGRLNSYKRYHSDLIKIY